MDDRRIDLSALDPGRDPERLERMVRSVLARAGRPPASPLSTAVVSRGRVAVLVAVAAAALAWIPALAGRSAAPATARSAAAASSAGSDAVSAVATWADAGEIPADADLYLLLGANDER
ncbi:MAG TPA: hypothetical protein VFM53_10435 [Anaeromyxobacteraceae bacterium]|nr:hypothetical protein [Anaeromyxobacteraceae bacterium]